MMSRIDSRHRKNFYRSPFSKWPPQYRTNSTLSDFNDILYVGRLWCPEFIPDIEKFLAVAVFKMAAKIQHCPISSKFYMCVYNDVPNWFPTLKNVTGRQFQNGRHNTAQIQHCSISTKFHMLVAYDDLNWFPTSINLYRSPFLKWAPQYRKHSTLLDFKGSFWFIF